MPKKVFISYSRRDFKRVDKIVRDLKSKTGLDYWMDLDGIESDESNFVRVICGAIDEAELMLFFVSKSSMKSPWTIREVDYARNTGKRIVPIVFDGSKLEGEFLFEFGRANVTDVDDELQYKKLCESLIKWTTSPESNSLSNESQKNDTDDAEDTINKTKHRWLIKNVIVATTLALLVGALVFLLAKKGGDDEQSTEAQAMMQNSDSKEVNARDVFDETFIVDGVSFTMVGVKGGTFTMGATNNNSNDAFEDEKPAHSVTLSSFHIGKTEVTQELWEAVMGNNPSKFKGAKHPVEQVSWDDCQEFIRKLNEKTGKNFRLPTEAEWEFAARGGNKNRGYMRSGSNNIDDVAWYTKNSESTTHDVATKAPNELGIYDMCGNVYEWCNDLYGPYVNSSQINPKGASSGSTRVDRGGSWSDNGWSCRVSDRDDNTTVYNYDDLGFRLAL